MLYTSEHPERTKTQAGIRRQKIVGVLLDTLTEHKRSLMDVLTSLAGRKAWPKVHELVTADQNALLANVTDYLQNLGKANRRASTWGLLHGLDKRTWEIVCNGSSLDMSYIRNIMTPKYTKTVASSPVYTQQYKSNVKRNVVSANETRLTIRWCTEVEFHPHSGDTTETYYRPDSMDTVYYIHY